MVGPKKRPHWKERTTLKEHSPIHKLATYAEAAPYDAEGKKSFRLALCDRAGGFAAAFDSELVKENVDLDDLTDQERAFCSGWAFLASIACEVKDDHGKVDPKETDKKIAEFIKKQLDHGEPGDLRDPPMSG